MSNYQSAIIYKLTSVHTDRIYIGSTTKPLLRRKQEYQSDFKRFQNGKWRYTTSYALFELGPVNIELIEDYPCRKKTELEAREGLFINQEPNSLNKQHPGRNQADYGAEYYQVNRDRICARKAEKIHCDVCNSVVRRDDFARHKKSKKCSNSSESNRTDSLAEIIDRESEELTDRLTRL